MAIDMSLVTAENLFNYLYNNQAISAASDEDEDIIVLFTTKDGSGPGKKSPLALEANNSFIKNAVYFDLDGKFSDQASDISTTMLAPHIFAKRLGELGIRPEQHIVIYDDYGNFYASRVWFMLKSIGHEKVSVLDGGLHRWLLLNYPVETNRTQILKPTDYTGTPNSNFQFVDQAFMLKIVENKTDNTVILDARSLSRFTGEEAETRANLRSGHIPGSYSLHYAALQTDTFEFLSKNELAKQFSPYQNKTLVFTCGSGVTACILTQAAHIVGFTTLYVYDGSWSQWGSDTSLPIESNAS